MVTSPIQRVVCLMESSVDGRLDESRWSVLYDEKGEGEPDVYYETRDRLHGDVFILGKKTVTKHFCSKIFKSESRTRIISTDPFLGIRTNSKITAVFDSKCELAYDSNEMWGTTLMAVLSEDNCTEEYLSYLRSKEISYVFAGHDGHNIRAALRAMYSDFGLRKVILCGGGLLNGEFLKQGLIDELYLILYPGIDGLSGINSIFEYRGEEGEMPCKGQSLELISCEVVRAGVVRLRYRFHFYEC